MIQRLAALIFLTAGQLELGRLYAEAYLETQEMHFDDVKIWQAKSPHN
jgi:hypothetical protein